MRLIEIVSDEDGRQAAIHPGCVQEICLNVSALTITLVTDNAEYTPEFYDAQEAEESYEIIVAIWKEYLESL